MPSNIRYFSLRFYELFTVFNYSTQESMNNRQNILGDNKFTDLFVHNFTVSFFFYTLYYINNYIILLLLVNNCKQ